MRRGRGSADNGAAVLVGIGYLYGSILAMVISYIEWRSILWAVWHSLLSWVYILYFALRY